MLEFKNTTDDRDFSVTLRSVRTGSDGPVHIVGPGETYSAELDGDYYLAVTTRAREPGEEPVDHSNAVQPLNKADPKLTDASDDQVRATIQGMVDSKDSLTAGGQPNLSALNAKLAEQGFNAINGDRRNTLMPQPA